MNEKFPFVNYEAIADMSDTELCRSFLQDAMPLEQCLVMGEEIVKRDLVSRVSNNPTIPVCQCNKLGNIEHEMGSAGCAYAD